MENINIGDRRTFTFKTNGYILKEILENPSYTLLWTWSDSICPHCQKRITNTTTHVFTKIEILLDETIAIENATRADIILLGDTVDGKRLVIPEEDYDTLLSISNDFKNII